MECKNYRTIALICRMVKSLLLVLLNRLKTKIEEHLTDEQASVRKDKNTVQQIPTLRLITEKVKRRNKLVCNCFINIQKRSIQYSMTRCGLL